jgi:hypothetical protein
MSFPDLIIGGIRIPRWACHTVNQSYDQVGGASLLRLGNGTGIIQSAAWGKLRTSLNCSGWAGPGLSGIDWQDPAGVTIACIEPRGITSPSNIIALPAARRLDEPVLGFAIVGDELLLTAVEVEDDVATLTTVIGATAYKVEWLPLINCFVDGGPKESYDSRSNEYSFSLDGEEL